MMYHHHPQSHPHPHHHHHHPHHHHSHNPTTAAAAAAYNHYNASQFFAQTNSGTIPSPVQNGTMAHPVASPMSYYTPTVVAAMPSAVSPITSTTGPLEPLASSTPLATRRSAKRSFTDDSTDEDGNSELTSKLTHLNDGDNVVGGHLVNRKKRRGMIEKRRRDRINNSLHELKRLVPAAFEKQGSAKLEKAEILQLTVDHLRVLHSKGFDAFSFDPQKFATDYHQIGFRECLTELTRYLAVHEGMDLQDPLRLRLMTHLHNYQSQREISLKSCTGWNPSLFTSPVNPAIDTISTSVPSITTTTPINIPTPSTPSSISPNGNGSSSGANNSANNSSSGSGGSSSSSNNNNSSSTSAGNNNNNNNNNNSTSCTDLNPNSSSTPTNSSSSSSYNSSTYSAYDMSNSKYASVINYAPYSYHTSTTAPSPYFPASGYAMSAPMMHPPPGSAPGQTPPGSGNAAKPYRPWGTELAY